MAKSRAFENVKRFRSLFKQHNNITDPVTESSNVTTTGVFLEGNNRLATNTYVNIQDNAILANVNPRVISVVGTAATANTKAVQALTDAAAANTRAEGARTIAATANTRAGSALGVAATANTKAVQALADAAAANTRAENARSVAVNANSNLNAYKANTNPRFDLYLPLTGGTLSANLKISSASNDAMLTIESTNPGTVAAPVIDLYKNSASPADGDYLGQLKFQGESDSGAKRVYAKFTGKASDVSNGSEDGLFEIAVRSGGSNKITNRLTGSETQTLNGTVFTENGNRLASNTYVQRYIAVANVASYGIIVAGFAANSYVVAQDNAILANVNPRIISVVSTAATANTTASAALPKAGGTMSGAIAMGTSKITGMGDPTANQDAATKAYVDTEVAAIVDSAPGTLNTLNELAAALGDDANFSTTVTNSIATKLPLAGGTLTGNVSFGDNDKAIFGAGSDLQIYHDGSDSFVRDAGTGNLRLQGTNLFLQNAGGTKNYLGAINSGAVTLYYDNASKLATESTGVQVTGRLGVNVSPDKTFEVAFTSNDTAVTTGNTLAGGGAGSGVLLENDSTTSGSYTNLDFRAHNADGRIAYQYKGTDNVGDFHFITDNTNSPESQMIIKNDGKVGIGVDPSYILHVKDSSSALAFLDDSGDAMIALDGSNGDFSGGDYFTIEADASSNLKFTLAGTEKMRIDSAGVDVTGGITATAVSQFTDVNIPDNNAIRFGSSQDLQIYHDGTNSAIQNGTGELFIYGGTDQIRIRAKNDEESIVANPNGTVDLYFNSSKKFATADYGITVTGDVRASANVTAVDITASGAISGATKSFDIEHPTKEGMRLHHGVLEGPEHAVYVRGKSEDSVIELPDYWTGLVHDDTINVQLTPIGEYEKLYVKEIKENKVTVYNDSAYFYYITAERKDVERFEVEYGNS